MHALALLIVAMSSTASPRAEAAPAPENLLVGPARCVLRYLEAVRLAGPHGRDVARVRPVPAHEQDYARARELTAPRTLAEIERMAARGEDHPLAPWRDAAHSHVLESFQLVSVRRAPRGSAVVTVAERWWRAGPGAPLATTVSEYLAARVDGEWKVIDRRPGGVFDDDEIAASYAGFFDAPVASP